MSSFYYKKGFTLIEVLVVIAIIFILVAIYLFNDRDYKDRYVTESVANEVAGSLRQIQVLGTSTKAGNTKDGTEIGPDDGYGLYITIGSEIVTFADLETNNKYDESQGEEISTQELTKGYEIEEMCAGTPASCSSVTELNLVVRRPDPGYRINAESGVSDFGEEYAELLISGGDRERTVKIWLTGKVQVE